MTRYEVKGLLPPSFSVKGENTRHRRISGPSILTSWPILSYLFAWSTGPGPTCFCFCFCFFCACCDSPPGDSGCSKSLSSDILVLCPLLPAGGLCSLLVVLLLLMLLLLMLLLFLNFFLMMKLLSLPLAFAPSSLRWSLFQEMLEKESWSITAIAPRGDLEDWIAATACRCENQARCERRLGRGGQKECVKRQKPFG